MTHTDRQTDRQTERYGERGRQRQRDRGRETETEGNAKPLLPICAHKPQLIEMKFEMVFTLFFLKIGDPGEIFILKTLY